MHPQIWVMLSSNLSRRPPPSIKQDCWLLMISLTREVLWIWNGIQVSLHTLNVYTHILIMKPTHSDHETYALCDPQASKCCPSVSVKQVTTRSIMTTGLIAGIHCGLLFHSPKYKECASYQDHSELRDFESMVRKYMLCEDHPPHHCRCLPDHPTCVE